VTATEIPNPQVVQLALCSTDIVATVQRYTTALGFADAGGRAFWGERISELQELDEPDPRCLVWWMVGRQDMVQIELFHHTRPAQRPQPADRRPCDLGWARFGIAVPDFDQATEAVALTGVSFLTEPMTQDGLRRVCFRDPEIGVIVELMEEGPALPGGIRPRYFDLVPAVVYATLSVADLGPARRFFADTVGLIEEPQTVLHTPELERLWGLEGARRDGFVVRGGDVYLEVVRYDDPQGAPATGRRLSDQGMMNVAVGWRERHYLEDLYARLSATGYPIAAELPPPPAGATYLRDDQGNSLEIMAIPREFDPVYGFVPVPEFQVEPRWPQPTTAPADRR
jgi:catechol 2,3-dioxygenase-like lactoylglutathione lyase family enzyme